ncbi:MAG: cell envelope integrity protein TolA [Gammaproteobacteria bacterium]|nr:cell envelope integrity protein TolA [Gammaproteobacteria bacterium]MBU1480437.1 cell envelope integrity protein TolA [Gammaproteobacteria bacterium]
MSTALAYQEPYRFYAGLLALAMHLVFLAVLYLGVHWQSRPPENFVVEMWESLPDTGALPEREPMPPAKMEPMQPPKVVSPSEKADIELRDKKSKKNAKKEKAAAKARQEAERRELEAYSRRREAEQARIQAEQERVRAEVNMAVQTQVERYQSLIRNKIRRKMKMVADVPQTAEAIFKVTLLPDGTLMDDPLLVKSSGFPAYDEAAERAILSAEPLPVPSDVSLQKLFRELKLSIRP